MNRVLFDYLRRKAWIFALCGALILTLTVGQSLSKPRGGELGLAGFVYQLSFFMAALPLSLELQRGVLRVTSILPIGSRALGRAWWWAGVGAPATLVSVLLLFGVIIRLLAHPEAAFPWADFGVQVLSVWLWLGSAFTLLFHLGTGAALDWRQQTKNVLMGVAWGLLAGGCIVFTRWIEKHVGAQVVFLTVGFFLTAFGWIRAEQLVLRRATLRVTAPAAEKAAAAPAYPDSFRGYGGVSYLLVRTSLRAIAFGLLMILVSPLMMLLGGTKDWRAALRSSVETGVMPFWFVLMFAILPVLTQLRFLRSLPISSARLALTLLSAFLIPCLALAAINAGVVGAVSGAEAAQLVSVRNVVIICSLALIVPLSVWRGFGRGNYLLLIILMVALQTIPLVFGFALRQQVSLCLACAGLSLPVALFLTKFALERGTGGYRSSVTALFPAWGGAR